MWVGIMHNAKHCFTSLNEVMFHWSSIAERLFWIISVFFKGAISPDFLFTDDNARSRINAKALNTLKSKDISSMQLPACALDLKSY